MLPGPVFNVELLTTARRARYYAARVLYGLILLLVIWQSYEENVRYQPGGGGRISISAMSRFAYNLFFSFAVAQSIAVALLTPILIAGVIADEKQRKTLHYLLTSRLSSAEIILGKLAARALQILTYLLIGLPIVALLGLLGGIDPAIVGLLDAATLTTSFFLGSLSILISTQANKVRDAIIGTYLIAATWTALPPIIDLLLRYNPPFKPFRPWIAPINDLIMLPNPIGLLIKLDGPGRSPPIWQPLAWFSGSQVVIGSIFIILAIWRLRPAFASSGRERSARSLSMRGQVWRAHRRRKVGDDPMLWKERFVGKPGGFLRVVTRVVAVIALLAIGYGTFYFGISAYQELFTIGYGGNGPTWLTKIGQFGEYCRLITSILFVAWGIGVATSAASGITSEKEEDTWTSLTTTDLTGVEILSSKMIGAVWRLRPLALAILGLWLLGLPLGSLHPFGFLAGIVSLAAFTWYAVALGSYLSMRSRTTTRAMALTVVALAITNVGYLLCCIPMHNTSSSLVGVGITPFLFHSAQLSKADVWRLLELEPVWVGYGYQRNDEAEKLATVALGVFLHGTAAGLLTIRSISSFDRLLDRPRRGKLAVPGQKPIAEKDV